MKVVDWISYDDVEGREEAVGSCGGVAEKLTRATYLAAWRPEAHPYIEAIWTALDELGPIDGTTHQESRCPVFDDGKVGAFSMRGWGDLVSAWWNDRHPDVAVNYCEFAWSWGEAETEAARAERLRATATDRAWRELLAAGLMAMARRTWPAA
jgi:hypothetical protein